MDHKNYSLAKAIRKKKCRQTSEKRLEDHGSVQRIGVNAGVPPLNSWLQEEVLDFFGHNSKAQKHEKQDDTTILRTKCVTNFEESRMNGAAYAKFLGTILAGYVDDFSLRGRNVMWFQLDCASIHYARDVITRLEMKDMLKVLLKQFVFTKRHYDKRASVSIRTAHSSTHIFPGPYERKIPTTLST
ncbi:hypothetical protein EVAR_34601_1 [Eumeta japonica]|uniref:Uncharacterized protein n=1 Tax=Eumeta variegata TaxID=151549 RepID=A0A4C1VFE6_EUMVA|nr:hypothetical protein EVAR_34601_1 [Eumeta japonica]